LLDVALAERRDSTIDFIRRCVGDFPDHPALEQFTEIGIPEGRAASFGLYLDYIVAMPRVGHILEAATRGWELVDQCFSRLIDVSQSRSVESELAVLFDSRLAILYYNRARARDKLHDTSSAKEDCDRAVALIDAAIERRDGEELYVMSETRANALRLRAILLHQDEDIPGALADLERILTDQNVFEATRGEALLVRAALYHRQGEDPAALRDYEQIIEMNGVDLAELRQIAVDEAMPLLWQEGNRALKAGNDESALQRYDHLLKLSQGHADLQAMTLVNKSFIHLRRMNPQAVIEDCNAVLNVPDSPPDQQVKALLHRSQAYLMLRQFELATNDVDEAFGSVSATARQRCTAPFIRAQIRYAQDDPKNAFEDLLAIAGQGECDADLRRRARQLLDQWRAR
jgi:tetratricopeptide (TPR) repeat protein